ncbi:hypothetical protein BN2476_530016 [Paraburkholderia piptadeniae]|uniref:Uncharacterized protein n=1 Tax=Paraburkholderia piptadeniae TaxID=1701573 RepID=A0A1N7SHI1_9BURK|nr:hypothetical protein BN2476_530016 [Paraburkholderia piptadeniae]
MTNIISLPGESGYSLLKRRFIYDPDSALPVLSKPAKMIALKCPRTQTFGLRTDDPKKCDYLMSYST